MDTKNKAKSVCYVNPTVLLRRPISELLSLENGRREVGLLIPRPVGKQRDTSLHHAHLCTKVDIRTYAAVQLPVSRFEWPIPGPGFLIEAYQILKKYDVVHIWAHFYLSNLLLILMSLCFPRTKVILTMDTMPGYTFSTGPVMNAMFRAYTWTLCRIVYRVPDAITLYGAALVPYARKCGISMKKVRVLPTGIIERKGISRSVARKKLENELSLETRTKIVLYVGILNPRKHITTFLAVARMMKGSDTIFVLAGDGPSREALESEARGAANIRFLGWRTDALELIAASDALLFPSAAEGLPGVVMEAMMLGTPVVTTSIPCITDLVTDGKDGSLCKIDDVACFTAKLQSILRDRALAARLSKAARCKIKAQYAWRSVLPLYEELYR